MRQAGDRALSATGFDTDVARDGRVLGRGRLCRVRPPALSVPIATDCLLFRRGQGVIPIVGYLTLSCNPFEQSRVHRAPTGAVSVVIPLESGPACGSRWTGYAGGFVGPVSRKNRGGI